MELNPFSDIEMFDPALGNWIHTRSMLHKRFAPAATDLNGVIYALEGYDGNNYLKYALGGYDGKQMVSSVEVYDPRTGSRTAGEEMNKSRGYSNAAVMDDKIYVFGGMCQANFAETVECYTEGRGWEVTSLKGVGKKVLFAAAVVLQTHDNNEVQEKLLMGEQS